MEDICFSGSSLGVLAGALALIQGVVGILFWGWIRSLQDSVAEARAERDRMADGWEKTIGLGERAVRRERRRA